MTFRFRCASAVAVTSLVLCAQGSHAFGSADATFQPLPNTATDGVPAYCAGISADGLTVFGFLGTYGSGWYWTAAEGLVDIGGGRLCAAANGSAPRICGLMGGFDGMDTPGIWTTTPYGWTPLGGLPGSPGCGTSYGTPYDMSRDGSVVGGLAWDGCKAVPFKWTQAGGVVALPMLDETAHYAARVYAVSGNGALFGGYEAQSNGIWRPVIWQNGTPSAIASFECAECGPGEVLALNDTGSIAVGIEQGQAFTWTPAEGMTILPNVSGGYGDFHAIALSDNGRVMVGRYGIGPGDFTAVIWIDRQPTRLKEYLIGLGATGLEDWTLWSTSGVSADGTVIVGTAIEPGTNHLVPYRATIPALAALCPADLDNSHTVDVNDLLGVISHWGNCPMPCPPKCTGDIVTDCSVNVNDLLAVITTWGACQ